jgi:hypothetical protein
VPDAFVLSYTAPESPSDPLTVSVRDGVDDPIPTFPLAKIVKRDDVAPVEEVEEETSKSGVVEP